MFEGTKVRGTKKKEYFIEKINAEIEKVGKEFQKFYFWQLGSYEKQVQLAISQ